jgi:hypothetical protein
MNVAAFALILLGATYVFLRRWTLSRSHLLRADGHALYFLVVAAAVPVGIWTATSLTAVGVLTSHPEWWTSLASAFLQGVLVEEKNPQQVIHFGLISVAALAASPVLAWVLNFPAVKSPALTARLLFRLGSVAELERFLWDASDRGLPVMVTLTSNKVYVGYSRSLPAPGPDKELIRLEPLLSGYRDDKQDFQWTTTYGWISSLPNASSTVGDLCRKDFEVILPMDKITSVHSFDLATYSARYSGKAGGGDPEELAPEQGPQFPLRDSSSVHTTKAELFYIAYVIGVAVLPALLAFDYPIVALGDLFLVTLCGFASAIDAIDA